MQKGSFVTRDSQLTLMKVERVSSCSRFKKATVFEDNKVIVIQTVSFRSWGVKVFKIAFTHHGKMDDNQKKMKS